jgi:hypothetical protein
MIRIPTYRRIAARALAVFLSGLLPAIAVQAQDGTWLLNATSDFGTAENWSSSAVPTGIAMFGASNQTTVTISSDAPIGQFSFASEAPAYSIALTNSLVFTGSGITNQSSNQPTIANNGYLLEGEKAKAVIHGHVDTLNNAVDTRIELNNKDGSIDYSMSLRGPLHAPTLQSEPVRGR